jgi:acyl carrier protein
MELKEKLQEVFREVFDDEDIVISEEMTADDIEDWDSLTHMELILNTEARFGVKFTTQEVLKLKNVGEFISLLEKKLN